MMNVKGTAGSHMTILDSDTYVPSCVNFNDGARTQTAANSTVVLDAGAASIGTSAEVDRDLERRVTEDNKHR